MQQHRISSIPSPPSPPVKATVKNRSSSMRNHLSGASRTVGVPLKIGFNLNPPSLPGTRHDDDDGEVKEINCGKSHQPDQPIGMYAKHTALRGEAIAASELKINQTECHQQTSFGNFLIVCSTPMHHWLAGGEERGRLVLKIPSPKNHNLTGRRQPLSSVSGAP